MPTINGNKLCVVCQQWKPATPEFFYNRTTPKGTKTFKSNCIECDRAKRNTPENKAKALERQRAWREKNNEHYIAHKREYENQTRDYHRKYNLDKYYENRTEIAIKMRARTSRKRAMQWNTEGAFTAEDLINLLNEQNGRCFYCGIPISFAIPGDIHQEHMTPFCKGGVNTLDNVVLACSDCNCSKGMKTLEHWQRVRGW